MTLENVSTKEIILWGLVSFGSLTGLGNTVYETQFADHTNVAAMEQEIDDLEDELTSLKIQLCLVINQVNRNAGQPELVQCGM